MVETTGDRRMPIRTTDKPFTIAKRQVYEAYRAVKSNGGAAGVDKQTIEQFEADLQNHLYKLWNRMSSGSYSPPPVRAVSIPKKSGGQRILGIPTVVDRVAQMLVKQLIEPDLEPIFLADSYGYRPGKLALDAIGVTRERCWRYDWVLEFDVKGLFDNIDHELLLRAVRKHVRCKWAHQPQRRPAVASALDQHVEDLALVVDGPPEIIRSPAIRITISSRGQRVLGRGR
jgi:group II intron reverse transcriptase/maturase